MFVHIESRPRFHWPWATVLLALAILSIALWQLQLAPDKHLDEVHRWGTIPLNLLDDSQLASWQWWLQQPGRLVSALFMHADWPHVVGNLLFLALFGLASERRLGSRRFLALYLCCGALANLFAAMMLAGSQAPIIGSSGAVSAVMGAYLALFPTAKLNLLVPLGLYLEFVQVPALLLIGIWFMLQVTYTYVGISADAVAWWAHISGFIIGAVFALLSRAAVVRRMRR